MLCRTSREEPPQQGGSAPKQCDLPTHDDTGPGKWPKYGPAKGEFKVAYK